MNLLEPAAGGGFYLAYAQLIRNYQGINGITPTGNLDTDAAAQAILQAEVSTYSGFAGGGALIGNAIAKFSAPDQYNLTLDQFSYDVANGLLSAIKQSFWMARVAS